MNECSEALDECVPAGMERVLAFPVCFWLCGLLGVCVCGMGGCLLDWNGSLPFINIHPPTRDLTNVSLTSPSVWENMLPWKQCFPKNVPSAAAAKKNGDKRQLEFIPKIQHVLICKAE